MRLFCSITALVTSPALGARYKASLGRTSPKTSGSDELPEIMTTVLVGDWDTDYWPDIKSLSLHSNRVSISKWKKGQRSKYLSGNEKAALHFFAESPKFSGAQGSAGQRVLIVTNIQPMVPDGEEALMADVEQRMDLMSEIRHRGRLYALKDRWVIKWDHGRKWWRFQETTASSNVTIDDQDDAPMNEHDTPALVERAEKMSWKLVRKWDEACNLKREVAGTPPIAFSIQMGIAGQAGYKIFQGSSGLSAQLQPTLTVTPQMVNRSKLRLVCIVHEIKQHALSQTTSPEEKARSTVVAQRIAHLVDTWATPSLMLDCWFGLSITATFTIITFPPWVWPIPSISVAFNWPLPYEDIKSCLQFADSAEILAEAYSARPNHTHGGRRPKKNAVSAASAVAKQLHSGSAFHASILYTQGPSFTIWPASSYAVGWNFNVDGELVVKMSQLAKDVSKMVDGIQQRPTDDTCKYDREFYFHAVVDWARSAYEVQASSSCRTVKERLALLKQKVPDLNLERDPFSVVPHVRQLAGPRYKHDDTYHQALGGGWIYFGTDGINFGYNWEVLPEPSMRYHNSDCKPFARFVNIYQRRVIPAREDIVEHGCKVDELPTLEYNSCQAVQAEFLKAEAEDLPSFPVIWVDIANKSRILHVSDSQCTRCLTVRSFGLPCQFCASELSELAYFQPTCRHYGSLRQPCLTSPFLAGSNSAKSPITQFDMDPRHQCVRRDNVRYVQHLPQRMGAVLPGGSAEQMLGINELPTFG